MNNSSSSSISALVPGGVVTTQNISTVIKPKENNNSMQFVKIQTPELSKKAVEQIRVAEESKITKDKIKEVEEEWQSNLLNWKSKRRQQFVGTHSNDNQDEQNNNQNDANENGRKIKTFAEMIEERTKTGNRLNFHLERYIGSSESDNYESEQDYLDKTDFVDREISQLSLNSNNNNNQSSHHHRPPHLHNNNSHNNNSSNLSDVDERITNSISKNHLTNDNNNFLVNSNGHQTDSAATENNSSKLLLVNDHGDRQENGAADDECDEEEEGDFDDTRPLNSTFKQGVDQPPTPPTIHSDDRIRPTLEVDTRTKEVSSAARFEDNGSDHDDEEDEQEEEQKHLQRIAFVAKLKAFEKMTQPSLQEPKFVAPKITKAPPPPPPILPSRSTHSNQSHHQSSTPPVPPPNLTPPIRNRQQNQQHQAPPPPPPPPLPQAKVEKTFPPEIPAKKLEGLLPVAQPLESVVQQQIPSPQLTRQQPQHHQAKPTASIQPHKHHEQEPPQLQALPIQPARKQPAPPIPTMTATPSTPTTSSPKQQPVLPQSMGPTFVPQSPTELPSASPALPSPIPPQSPQRQQVHKQQQQPLQQAPPRHQSQQQQQPQQQSPPSPVKEDKSQDRTVLSVSGKKRCSSCKEELGRGAAAFVIESLNLVYHTNCFRCSVCHVNLSNGFRGVDVRVHAGALHCQNCYSKDGLNYSRV